MGGGGAIGEEALLIQRGYTRWKEGGAKIRETFRREKRGM